MSQLLALCKRLIATPSVTTEGTRQVAEFCAHQVLAPAGIGARLIPSATEGPQQVNLLAFVEGRDRNAAPFLFNTHLDTVAPGDSALWSECRGANPFEATVKGDRIYGLGAADTKLDFAAKATALLGCGRPRRDVYLAATFGEEHGLVGARELAEAQLVRHGAVALVGEPSSLQLITAHKALVVFELTAAFTPLRVSPALRTRGVCFLGKAAHSSTPALGENAIVKALSAIVSHRELRVASINGGDAVNKVPARCEILALENLASGLGDGPMEGEGEASEFIPAGAISTLTQFIAEIECFTARSAGDEPGFAPPSVTFNPGVVRTCGGALVLEFELRAPPAIALDMIRCEVAEIVTRLSKDAPGVELSVSEKRANPGFRTPPSSEAVELATVALARAGLPLVSAVKLGCTEAGIYAAAGLAPVVFGPGPSTGVIHAPNEYNLLSEVGAAVRFYRALLEI